MTRKATADHTFVAGPEELDRLIAEAREHSIIGMDTEFLRERTYRAKLCLLQVSTRKGIYILDPLEDLDLKPIAELISDEDIEVVVHAGRQDFEIFFQEFGIAPRRVFDVQIAAGFTGHGASLPYGRIVRNVTGVDLKKSESYTDWCKRPLTERQLIYAANDVRYLIVIADRLKDDLVAGGRNAWIGAEMAYLEDPALYADPPEDAWRRVSGRGSLSGGQLAILKELASWRETTAARRNVPRGWVVKDQTLVEVARRAPGDRGSLKAIRGFPAKEADRSFDDIRAAIDRGREAEPLRSGPRPSRSAQARARTLSGIADAIVRARADAAGIATELVATRGEMEELLLSVFGDRPEADGHKLMQGWRRELAGEAVLDLAEGRMAVRSSDKPPFIAEVPLERDRDHQR